MSNVNSLKKEESAAQDNITTEYLLFAGGRLTYLLTKLFKRCLVHGYVPDALGSSVIVPVPKSDGSKGDVFKEYKPKALISAMAKVFETCLMLFLWHDIISNSYNLVLYPIKTIKKLYESSVLLLTILIKGIVT